MNISVRFLTFAGVFGLVMAVIYWFLSYEPAGTICLLLMGIAPIVMGSYIHFHRPEGPIPEDEKEVDPEEAEGLEVGNFSGGSIWPLVLGIGCVIGLEGFIYGKWLVVFGLLLFGWAIVGLMQESHG